MKDKNLLLRTSADGDLAANEQAEPWHDFGGPDRVPLVYDVIVPKADGTTPTLDVKIQVADTDGGAVQDEFVLGQITLAGVYPITIKSPHQWRRYHATIGGTAPDFGEVLIAPSFGGEYDKF